MAIKKPRVISYIKAPVLDAKAFARLGVQSGHFTNGIYSYEASLIVPTVLAGFHYVTEDAGMNDDSALIIAVNSNKSMAAIMDKKCASQTERAALEDEMVRARKVAEPLALQHPDRKAVVLFYDEETPDRLYEGLKTSGFRMKTLFKWGYGTKPGDDIIVGAQWFERVLGFPLPNDIKPVCAGLTGKTGQQGDNEVVDLRGTLISADNKCLFRMGDPRLSVYGALETGAQRARRRGAKPRSDIP